MATRKEGKTPENGLLIQNLEIKQIKRDSVDIKKWRDALKAAEGQNENRKLLYELYEDMLLDGHLKSIVGKRIMSITNSPIQFTKDEKKVEELDKVLKSKAFKKILKYIIQSKIYGHSLFEFIPTDTELGFKVELVDRRHVKPRLGIVAVNPNDTKGDFYREEPFVNFAVEVGEKNDFGLILQACQYAIYKRGEIGDWADYIQLFGIPMRHGKYKNPETKNVLYDALINMGSSGVAVTPEDAIIEVVRAEGSTGANLVFKNFREAMNDEMSVTILGQTMTTSDSGNSGYAQGLVHQAVEGQMHKDDREDVLTVLNDDVIRVLANLGYPVEGGEFSYPDVDTLTLEQRIAIDEKVTKFVPVDADYFYNKYKIPKPTTKETVGGMQQQESGKEPKQEDKPGKKEKKLSDNNAGLLERILGFFVKAPQPVGHYKSK
jgi:hypothetical protein